MRAILIVLIRGYQLLLSPLLGKPLPFYPSCSPSMPARPLSAMAPCAAVGWRSGACCAAIPASGWHRSCSRTCPEGPMMENQRLLLFAAMAFVLFLLWQNWLEFQAKKHPPPAPPVATAPAGATGPG